MRSQRGAVLLIVLIMLVLLTLFAVSALNTGTTNLKVVGNMQARNEATNAAQQAIETVLSTPLFVTNPSNAVLNPCGAPNTLCLDKNGNSVTNPANAYYTTTLVRTTPSAANPTPACVSVQVIQMSELDVVNRVEDRDCASETPQGSWGIFGTPTGNSLCANTVWEITAETTATASGATVTVTQGVGVRTSANVVTTSCL
jgi:Tfp pilus assembly protein PilX